MIHRPDSGQQLDDYSPAVSGGYSSIGSLAEKNLSLLD